MSKHRVGYLVGSLATASSINRVLPRRTYVWRRQNSR
jgi:hypothetical protein